jgi:hypothetical protein
VVHAGDFVAGHGEEKDMGGGRRCCWARCGGEMTINLERRRGEDASPVLYEQILDADVAMMCGMRLAMTARWCDAAATAGRRWPWRMRGEDAR